MTPRSPFLPNLPSREEVEGSGHGRARGHIRGDDRCNHSDHWHGGDRKTRLPLACGNVHGGGYANKSR
jgi:hypothetical protein